MIVILGVILVTFASIRTTRKLTVNRNHVIINLELKFIASKTNCITCIQTRHAIDKIVT